MSYAKVASNYNGKISNDFKDEIKKTMNDLMKKVIANASGKYKPVLYLKD